MLFLLHASLRDMYDCYGWMNSKAMAQGPKWNGYSRYEAQGAAACMAKCASPTLVKVRAGLRAGEVVQGGRAQSPSHVVNTLLLLHPLSSLRLNPSPQQLVKMTIDFRGAPHVCIVRCGTGTKF
jgi:hypothetical protein